MEISPPPDRVEVLPTVCGDVQLPRGSRPAAAMAAVGEQPVPGCGRGVRSCR